MPRIAGVLKSFPKARLPRLQRMSQLAEFRRSSERPLFSLPGPAMPSFHATHWFCTLLLCTAPHFAHAAQSVRSGDWADPATWGGAVPGSTEEAIIRAGHTVTVTTAPPHAGVQIGNGGALIVAESGRLQICQGCMFDNAGSVEISGMLTLGDDISGGATYKNWKPFLIQSGGSLIITRNVTFENAQSTLDADGDTHNFRASQAASRRSKPVSATRDIGSGHPGISRHSTRRIVGVLNAHLDDAGSGHPGLS